MLGARLFERLNKAASKAQQGRIKGSTRLNQRLN
jgi:hypothetical protein